MLYTLVQGFIFCPLWEILSRLWAFPQGGSYVFCPLGGILRVRTLVSGNLGQF